jgi:hypothetical protein
VLPSRIAVETTQWIIAFASLGSAILALALALGLKEWIFRPRVQLVLRDPGHPEEISDRVLTERLESGKTAAFVRVRLVNRGRSTARNVCLRVVKVHWWDRAGGGWIRARPELDGRLLQPSNRLANEPTLMDVFPRSDGIVDLASVEPTDDGTGPILVEITRPWPANGINELDPGTWRLELMICGDNVAAQRLAVLVAFDGTWPHSAATEIWDHFLVHGPSSTDPGPPDAVLLPARPRAPDA